MPTSGTDKSDFQKLANTYGITNSVEGSNIILRGGPLNFTHVGYVDYYEGTLFNQGLYGSHWSSTLSSSTDAYCLDFNSANVAPQNIYYRVSGYSMRCYSALKIYLTR